MSRHDPDQAPTEEAEHDPVLTAALSPGVRSGRKQPERIRTEANLVWPPTKDDLERMYLKEHHSAAKISNLYGLKYENPKCGEVLILYHLKHKGIARRGAADHVRKVTEGMVDEWVRRYEAGESLKQIAGEEVGAPTVFVHLRKRGLKLRDKVEEVIRLNTIHKKKSFNGDPGPKAYLIGIAKGDYWVTRHGRAIRVRLSTTHPAMAKLFRELLGPYGPIYEFPKSTPLTEFEWCLDCDLNLSFRFLEDREQPLNEIFADKNLFLNSLGGFFDAEGSIYYHKKKEIGAFEFSLGNTNEGILRKIAGKLSEFGYTPSLTKEKQSPRGRHEVESLFRRSRCGDLRYADSQTSRTF